MFQMVVSPNTGKVFWKDIFHKCICCKFCNVFEMTKINKKEAGVGPFFKVKFFDVKRSKKPFARRTVLKVLVNALTNANANANTNTNTGFE